MSAATRRRQAGWPNLLREAAGLQVRTNHVLRNKLVHIPAGTALTVTFSQKWDALNLRGPACEGCGISAVIEGVGWHLLTPLPGDVPERLI